MRRKARSQLSISPSIATVQDSSASPWPTWLGLWFPPLQQTISGLRTGLLLAVLVIFLLLAANFQSVRLALAILLTVPAVLCGVVLMLRITDTTLNVQSFMGAVMAIGIAVANSILLVTFAEHARHEGQATLDAAHEGATGRLRAVLMTAAAMIAGMTPMAIGFGEG